MEVKVSGAEAFERLSKRLRELGEKEIRAELNKRIRQAAVPVAADVRSAVLAIPTKGSHGGGGTARVVAAVHRREGSLTKRAQAVAGKHGTSAESEYRTLLGKAAAKASRTHSLRAAVAAATKVKVSPKGAVISVDKAMMPEGQKTLPARLDGQGKWRHPVFGHRAHWVDQQSHPYFYVTIKGRVHEFQTAVVDAMADIASRIAK